MAIKYVSNSTYGGRPLGNDANDGSIGSPWLTIQKGVDAAPSGDTVKINQGTYNETLHNYLNLDRAGGVALTFEPWGVGDVVTLDTSSTGYAIRSAVFGIYIFKEIDIKTASATWMITCDSNTDYDLTFDHCDIDTLGSTTHYLFYSNTHTSAPEGSIVFKNGCTFTNNSDSGQVFYVYDCKTFQILDSTITRTNVSGTGSLFLLNGKIGLFDVQRNTIFIPDMRGINCYNIGPGEYVERLRFKDNMITGGSLIVYMEDQDIGLIEIDGNTITSSYDGTKFFIGRPSGAITNYLRAAKISSNKITFTGASGFCMLLGTNCYGAQVYNNDFKSTLTGDYGVVIRGKYNSIHNNRIESGNPIYIGGGQYNTIWNNTAIAISGRAFAWNKELTDLTAAIRNDIFNNIFDGSAGGDFAVYDATSTGDHWDNRFDHNVLITGSTDLARLDGTNYNTIAAMQSKWASWSDFWPENDKNSFTGRVIRQMGRPGVFGDRPHVGAVGPVGTQNRDRYKILGEG